MPGIPQLMSQTHQVEVFRNVSATVLGHYLPTVLLQLISEYLTPHYGGVLDGLRGHPHWSEIESMAGGSGGGDGGGLPPPPPMLMKLSTVGHLTPKLFNMLYHLSKWASLHYSHTIESCSGFNKSFRDWEPPSGGGPGGVSTRGVHGSESFRDAVLAHYPVSSHSRVTKALDAMEKELLCTWEDITLLTNDQWTALALPVGLKNLLCKLAC